MKLRSLIRSIKVKAGLVHLAESYKDTEVALATLHRKERVIAPTFRRILGARIVVAPVDTDTLGTFSGEIPRTSSPRAVVITKARMGMEELGVSRGIATEGTFGPHPTVPFLTIHHELMAFIDLETGIEVVEQQSFSRSIFNSIEIDVASEARDFLSTVRFGRYGIIVQAELPGPTQAIKGLRTMTELEDAIAKIKSKNPQTRVRLSTDMRAHMNPLRMWRIRGLAHSLAMRLCQRCPACGAPGWGKTGYEGGLPCEECGAKTEDTLHLKYSCSACRHEQRVPRPDGKKFASACHCSWCNP